MSFNGILAIKLANKECSKSWDILSEMMILCNENNEIALSQEQLGLEAGVGRGTTIKALKTLEKFGLVVSVKVKGGAGSYYMVNPYEWSTIARTGTFEETDKGTGEVVESKRTATKYAKLCKQYLDLGGKKTDTPELREYIKHKQGAAKERPVYNRV